MMRGIVVHCSATGPKVDIGAREIDDYHKKLGWKGCGYHEVIRRNGQYEDAKNKFPCRVIGKPAAHARGRDSGGYRINYTWLGICLVGGVDTDGVPDENFTPAQWETFLQRIDAYRKEYDIPFSRILGHRDVIKKFATPDGPKACPCFDVQTVLDEEYGLDAYEEYNDGEISGDLVIPTTHLVRKGDTFTSLSRLYGVPREVLATLNPGYPLLKIGETVYLAQVR